MEVVIEFKEKEVARKEIIDSLSIFVESVFYTYLMLFKLLIGSVADGKIPFMLADLSLCQLYPSTSLEPAKRPAEYDWVYYQWLYLRLGVSIYQIYLYL